MCSRMPWDTKNNELFVIRCTNLHWVACVTVLLITDLKRLTELFILLRTIDLSIYSSRSWGFCDITRLGRFSHVNEVFVLRSYCFRTWFMTAWHIPCDDIFYGISLKMMECAWAQFRELHQQYWKDNVSKKVLRQTCESLPFQKSSIV